MAFSDKLNGFWEEGYHYYLEFRDDKMTVRRYDRVIELETTVSYDAAAMDRGEAAVIIPENNRLSSSLTGEMMREIHELRWENGELKLTLHNYADEYRYFTLKKAEHGPFDHIVIRDGEFLEGLQGVWKEWGGKDSSSDLIIRGNELKWRFFGSEKFHVISYNYNGRYDPDRVYLVPEDLTRDSFSSFSKFDVKPDMLITTMMVYDMSVPSTVFAREDMLDKIEVPGSAKRTPVNTMMHTGGSMTGGLPAMVGFPGMGMMPEPGVLPWGTSEPAPQPDVPSDLRAKQGPTVLEDGSTFCPVCGAKLGPPIPKFCSECGSRIRK